MSSPPSRWCDGLIKAAKPSIESKLRVDDVGCRVSIRKAAYDALRASL